MKKHDEGYTIPLVLVVMVIMILVASLVLANSLQTAQSQQKAILQMQDKYAAEGKIEMLVALLCEESTYSSMAEIGAGSIRDKVMDQCALAGATLVDEDVKDAAGEIIIAEPVYTPGEGMFAYVFTVYAEQDSTKITTRLKLVCKIEKDADTDMDVVKIPQITYETYQIGGVTE